MVYGIYIFIFALLGVCETYATSCEVNKNDKITCGWIGIGFEDCAKQHCCYDGSTCFYPSGVCAIDPPYRIDCGYPGIGNVECLSRNCCFDGTTYGIQCFQRTNVCGIQPFDRYSCGHADIEQRECEAINCCFDHNSNECYQRALTLLYTKGGPNQRQCIPLPNEDY